MPPMNKMGMNTATSDTVIAMIVNSTSFAPSNAARIAGLPISMCRPMFSSMTIVSSTTNPMQSVRAINERLSRL